MSSYHVSDTHINALLSWAKSTDTPVHINTKRLDLTKPKDFKYVGDILRDCNNASMTERYNDDPKEYTPKVVDVKRLLPINIVRACDCFGYQACEYKGWETSDGMRIIEQIKYAALTHIDGYDEVWSIDEDFLQGERK